MKTVAVALLILFASSFPLAAQASKCAVNASYEVVAYYFPNYHPNPQNQARYGKGWTEWRLLQQATPRFAGHQQPKVPLWGYDDESTPGAMARRIDAAAGHGVTCFLFDWYWHNTGPFLDRALDRGFLQAANRSRIKFALMWANHDWIEIFPAKPGVKPELIYPGAVSRETFDRLADHAIRNYFTQPNYWKVDGKPYFSIYELMTFVKGLGGLKQARLALDDFREKVKAAGLPGLHVNAVAFGIKPQGLAGSVDEMLSALNVDSVTSYCWIHHAGLRDFPATQYPAWAEESARVWDQLRGQFQVPYYPNVSMGWDSTPRTDPGGKWENFGYPYTPVVAGNTPAEFRKALERVKKFLDQQPAGPKIFTINAWNEWTEGSYLEPDKKKGWEYLRAIQAVFGQGSASR